MSTGIHQDTTLHRYTKTQHKFLLAFIAHSLHRGKFWPFILYLIQALTTISSKWNVQLQLLGDKRHLSQSALEKLTMNEDEKFSIKTWETETDTNLKFFNNICIFGGVFFFPYSDIINIFLQLKFCIEEECRSRIASALSNKTNRYKIKEMH